MTARMNDSVRLEAVYYSAPLPRSLEAVSLMGLVFDRVYFPHVYLPDDGFTVDEANERAAKLTEYLRGRTQYTYDDQSTATMIRALRFLTWKEWTKDFLVYTNIDGNIFEKPGDGGKELVKQIYDLTFGPPRDDFEPTFESGHTFGIGEGDAYIAYPGDFYYPAMALLFAAERGLPIINDVPMLAVPGLSGSVKDDAKALASILAVECVQFLLPLIPPIDIYDLLDFRDEMKPHVEPFRLALLRLARQLNMLIEQGASAADIQQKARFVVETDINPLLIELKNFAESPDRPWYQKALNWARPASQLAASYFTLPQGAPIADTLTQYGGLFAAALERARDKESAIKRSPMYYLLRISEFAGKG